MHRPVVLGLALLALAAVGIPALAQTIGATEPITLSISPKYPRPNQQVTVTVSSNLVNLAASEITISLDGAVISTGRRSATFTMGPAGKRMTVSASVNENGRTYTKELSVSGADVALVMEPGSTAHPFYEGGLLVAPEGEVRLIALADLRSADGTKIPPNQLSYVWKLGERILNEQSGLGRTTLEATAPVRYRDARVSVTVSTKDGTQSATASVMVSPSTPQVRVYRVDPLGGPDFANAVGSTFALPSAEETFRAIPYFFARQPSIAWVLNGAGSGSEEDVTVRTSGSNAGNALLGVTVADGTGEQAQSRVTLQFGGSFTNIFGF
jgi:hypothetical protein